MNRTDRSRLAKVLPLLASDKPGERDAAVLAAGRILAKAGMSWADVLPDQPPPEHREPLIGRWRQVCAELAKRPGALRVWERRFVTELPNFPRISTKQRYVLAEISRRVLGDQA